jgi:hypothetical protein
MRTAKLLAIASAVGILVAPVANLASQAGASPKPKPQLTDAKGDYPVASADIVSATLSSVPAGTQTLLRIDLTLAAPPMTVTPYSYTLGFIVSGCQYRVVYFGHPFRGVLNDSTAGCITGDAVPHGRYSIEGSTITFTVPMSGALKRGARATDLFATTEPGAVSSAGTVATIPVATFGDTATGTDWVLGSDRPKKK